MSIQPAIAFTDSLDETTKRLQDNKLPQSQWQELISSTINELLAQSDGKPKLGPEIPSSKRVDEIKQRYSLAELETIINKQITDTVAGTILTRAQTQALNHQIQWLMDCQRYHGRRSTPRACRIVNAAHRRDILASRTGPLRTNLEHAVEVLLSLT